MPAEDYVNEAMGKSIEDWRFSYILLGSQKECT